MKKTWLPLLMGVILLALAAPLRAEPAYWIISDDDTEILLIGTVHMGRSGEFTLPAEVNRSLSVADRLYLEVAVDTRQGAQGGDGISAYGRLPEGQTLKSLLPEAVYARLRQKVIAMGFTMQAIEGYRPWAAAIMVQTTQINQMGFRHEDGVEALITELADRAGLEMRGLEAPNTTFAYLEKMSPEADLEALTATLDEMDKVGGFLEQVMVAWKAGDLAEMEELLLDSMEESPEFAEAILHKRTRDWVAKTVDLMDVPGVFVIAVGTGHLLGEKGMPALLGKAGLRIRRADAGS